MGYGAEMDDPRALAISLRSLGNVHFDRGDYVTPGRLFEESLDLMKQAGDEAGVADAYNNLGVLATYSDDWDVAGDLYSRGVGDLPGPVGHPRHRTGSDEPRRGPPGAEPTTKKPAG